MAPYKIAVVPVSDAVAIEMIVPAGDDLTVASLVETALKRAIKISSCPLATTDTTELRLNSSTGYHVDADDRVVDVLSPGDVLVIVLAQARPKTLPLQTKTRPQKLITASTENTQFQIRVITPSAAVQHAADILQIPLLKGGQVFSDESSLCEIREAVCEHFQLDSKASSAKTPDFCNCKLADQLLARGNWQKHTCVGHRQHVQCDFRTARRVLCARCFMPLIGHAPVTDEDGNCQAYVLYRQDLPCGHTIHSSCIESDQGHWYCPNSCQFVSPTRPDAISYHCTVVFGAHHIEIMEIGERSMAGILAVLRDRLGEDFGATQCVHTKGGVESDGRYSVLPFVSVCSVAKHKDGPAMVPISSALASPQVATLDLHTAESPLNTHHLDQTVRQVGLYDLVVNGTLSLYALSRRDTAKTSVKKFGKNETYTAAPHWEASATQSDRATSIFLSSLRMFAHVISSKEFGDHEQNEVLGLVHQLTRYPPTVRAIHVLMGGKTLQQNESAAIIQSFDAVLQIMVPRQIIQNDATRVLEGSRLLFGLILARMRKEKAKNDGEGTDQQRSFAYIKGYHTADIRDFKLGEPISGIAAQTTFGLVDQNVFVAHENGGVFGYTPADSIGLLATGPDYRVLRIACLSDGQVPEVTYYDSDTIAAALQSSSFDLTLKDVKRFSTDLKYLASLCEDTAMAVVRPRNLPTASVPCLTLSRAGNLAVNLGHAPCSHNMLIFMPLSGTEHELDAAVVEQVLEPIVQERERDGTSVFDLFSMSYNRKSIATSELLIFVVDSSYSMRKSSDFAELNDRQNDPVMPSLNNGDLVMDEYDSTAVSYLEIKDWVTTHESFQDMLSLVKGASSTRAMPTVAKGVLCFLRTLTSRELAYFSKQENQMRSWASSGYMRGRSTEGHIDTLRRQLSGLEIYQKALIDMLVFHARDPAFSPSERLWYYGEPIPVDRTSSPSSALVDITEEFVVPDTFICPISQAVFEDPVRTSDLLGPFDRRAIERWFRIRKSSPMTGLPLEDSTLRHDQVLHDEIKRWINGEDIIAAAPPVSKRSRSEFDDGLTTINFIAPTGSFTRQLPDSLSSAALHRIAFRGMRGVHTTFSLFHRGNSIAPSADAISQQGLEHAAEVVIHTSVTSLEHNAEDICLIKIYSDSQDLENCAYWVSRRTPATVASMLFRHWLANQHNHEQNNPDRQVWTGLHPAGDGRNYGQPAKSWDKITTLFNTIQPQRLIRNEALIHSQNGDNIVVSDYDEWEDENDFGSEAEVRSDRHYRVLKVSLEKYVNPEQLEARALRKLRTFTRIGISKQVFNAFINRLIAYSYPTTVGLVTFGSKALLTQPMTDVIENFRTAVDRIEPGGDTALWDAVHLAADQLIHHRKSNQALKCRIICLSDGCDTNSTRNVEEVCQNLVKHGIVLDSVSIGDEDNLDLKTVSYLTGGYAFVPRKLEDAIGVCELEPVLSQHERPAIVRPVVPALITAQGFRLAATHASATPFNRDIFPARKKHPRLEDSFVKISALQGRAQNVASDDSQGIQSGIRTRRLLTEIRDISMNPHPSYDVYVSESNMGFWKVVLAGPAGSAYENAAFMLYLDFPEDYPRVAPKGRFVTPVFHPNISRHGLICHSIFDRNWAADTTSRQVLDTVFGLLLVPEFSEPINTTVILAYYWDEVAFRDEVQKEIEKSAKKGREEFGAEILGEEWDAVGG